MKENHLYEKVKTQEKLNNQQNFISLLLIYDIDE